MVDGNEHVARIDAHRRGRERKWLRQLGGQVLERMHGEIYATVGQRFFNFLGEHALGTHLRECHFLQTVSGGLDDLDFHVVTFDA